MECGVDNRLVDGLTEMGNTCTLYTDIHGQRLYAQTASIYSHSKPTATYTDRHLHVHWCTLQHQFLKLHIPVAWCSCMDFAIHSNVSTVNLVQNVKDIQKYLGYDTFISLRSILFPPGRHWGDWVQTRFTRVTLGSS